MKILMISHEYPPIGGGGANACMNLASEYAKAGNTVSVVTVWFEGTSEKDTTGNMTIYRVKSSRKHMEHCNFFEMLDFIFKARIIVDKLESREKFDICQVFFGIPSGPLGVYLKRKYNLPYVIRFGGGDIPGFQDRFSKVYSLISPAIKIIWKEAESLVANSSGLRKRALDYYDGKEVIVIPNGAEVRAFSYSHNETISHIANVEDRQSIIRLLFVSRLIERKGLQDILPQMEEIVKECNNVGITITLDVVGDGPFGDKLKEKVLEEGLEDIVCFHGQKDKTELPNYYSNADIFVFPSRKEGMPNVVLEAMSYGLPVVMTHCEGSDELVQGNGFICNIEDFADRIMKLSLSPMLRDKMGNRSVELIRNFFAWKKIAEEYLVLFDGVISRK